MLTIHYVENNFYWLNMVIDIKNVIKECSICQTRKTNTQKTKEYLLPRTADYPFEQIVVDIAEMQTTFRKNKYVLVIIDQMSKLVCLVVINNQKADTILQSLLVNWIFKFGKPKCIVSDLSLIHI